MHAVVGGNNANTASVTRAAEAAAAPGAAQADNSLSIIRLYEELVRSLKSQMGFENTSFAHPVVWRDEGKHLVGSFSTHDEHMEWTEENWHDRFRGELSSLLNSRVNLSPDGQEHAHMSSTTDVIIGTRPVDVQDLKNALGKVYAVLLEEAKSLPASRSILRDQLLKRIERHECVAETIRESLVLATPENALTALNALTASRGATLPR